MLVMRHGQCTHNLRDRDGTRIGDRLWMYSNDDAFGLTADGIHEVVEMTKSVDSLLQKRRSALATEDFVISWVTSPAFRAQSTMSLVASTLVHDYGYAPSQVNVDETCCRPEYCTPRALQELPSPTLMRHLWKGEDPFKFHEYEKDPFYTWNGFSFVKELRKRSTAYELDFLGSVELTLGWLPDSVPTVVVAHHYSICLMLYEACVKLRQGLFGCGGGWLDAAMDEKLIRACHSFYPHHHVVYDFHELRNSPVAWDTMKPFAEHLLKHELV